MHIANLDEIKGALAGLLIIGRGGPHALPQNLANAVQPVSNTWTGS